MGLRNLTLMLQAMPGSVRDLDRRTAWLPARTRVLLAGPRQLLAVQGPAVDVICGKACVRTASL